MKIKEKWYDGKYYSKVRLIQEENTTEKPYWGIENASLTIESPSLSLLNALSGRCGLSISKQVTLLEQDYGLDSYDKEIVARIAASGLLTQKQLADYLKLCGLLPAYWDPLIEYGIMQHRLNNLFSLAFIEKVVLSYSNGLPKHTAYRITKLGEELARRQGVHIHLGNRYRSQEERERTGVLDTPAEIMRVLAANNLAIQLLNETDDIRYLNFMTTPRLEGATSMSGMIRCALTAEKEDGSSYLFEVFRRPDIHDPLRKRYEGHMRFKVRSYFKLLRRKRFLEKNRQNLKTIPKLVIVAEDSAHIDELENILAPLIADLMVDERAEVIFITDYGFDTGKIYHPEFFTE